MTLCVASQRVFIVLYFVIDSVVCKTANKAFEMCVVLEYIFPLLTCTKTVVITHFFCKKIRFLD
jgi:hypothetical protein